MFSSLRDLLLNGNGGGLGKQGRRRLRKPRRKSERQRLFERLEPRVVLNAAPVAGDDPWYSTAEDTDLSVGSSDTTLLDNDWDPEGSSLTAAVVANPSSGSLTTFNADGTFTYSPNSGFSGIDSFTYVANDGSVDSNVVTVSMAVGGDFGVRTNLEEVARGGSLLTGGLELTQALTPGLGLVYQSNTLPEPIVVVDTSLLSTSTTPDDIDAQLTFDSSAGTTYGYSTTGLSPGDSLRFALQADATSLATGHYDYSVDLTANWTTGSSTRTFTGSQDVVNRDGSSQAFGRGWQLAGLDELVVDSGSALWVQAGGDALWFASDGSGGYLSADGDATFSSLVKNGDNTYTLTGKQGGKLNFDTSGLLASRVDRNGNTVSYTYTSGLLTKITDPFSRDTTFSYTSGQLTSVTDFAGRTATLAYDANGRLSSITQPDPDGAGSQAAPVTSFEYDATTHRLTKVTDALSQATQYTYGSHGRLTTITHPDNTTWQLTSLQTIGLPTGTSGNSLTSADPLGTVTDERGYNSTFRTDRFGNVIEWNNQLAHQTLAERNAAGQVARLTEADPDGGGSLTSPVTIFGYDAPGNLAYQQNPDSSTKTSTYTTTFNQLASTTDELGRTQSFAYDSTGNLTTSTDGAGYSTTYTYNSQGLTTSITTPDPDGGGPLVAAVTSLAYDAYGRLVTITNPDSSTRTLAYDSADNLTSETDELGNAATITYDALDRLTSSTDRESAATSFEYDAMGQLVTQTDALGNATDYEYNNRGWQTKVTRPDPDGTGPLSRPESTYQYDAVGHVTQIGDWSMGGSTQPITHTYDAAGRRTQTDGPLDGKSTSYTYDNLGRLINETDDLMRETNYEYDSLGRVTKVAGMDPDYEGPLTAPATTFSYDAAGQLVGVTDPRGYTTTYEFDARGLLTVETSPDPDGSGPQFAKRTPYRYDNAGRRTRMFGLYCRVTEYEYDNRGRLTKLTLPSPDPGGPAPTLTYTYDAAGNRLTETNPLGNVTSYAYDKTGRVTTITEPDPDGAGPLASPVTSFVYNAMGNITSTTDPLGGVASFEYDNMGRKTKVTAPDPDGAGPLSSPVTQYEYNGSGSISKITDPEGRDTTFQYDDIGRRSGVTDHLGNQTTYTYDDFDNLTGVTQPDPDGAGPLVAAVTAYAYDDYDRRTSTTDPEGGVTSFTYDDAGNVLSITDPVNNTTNFAYDGLGRLTIETNQLGDARSFEYEAAGNLARRTDRNGRVIQYTHDDLERLTNERWYENGSPTPSLSITTDTEGGSRNEVQRVGFTDDEVTGGTFTLTAGGETTSALAYNATAAQVESALEALSSIGSGNVSVTKYEDEMTWTTEWTLTFQSGLAGTNVAQTTIDTSNLWQMMYTLTDIQATDTEGGVFDEVQTITLSNASGGTLRLAFRGETTAPLNYDATAADVDSALEELNAVDQLTVTGSAGGPWTVTFAGTHVGTNVSSIMGDATGTTNGTLVRTITFDYDAASQLTDVSDPDSTYAYTYDNLGRVLTVDNSGTSGVADIVLTSAYDANNNRTSLSATIDSTDDFLNSYTYDSLNRLTQLDQEGQTGGNSVAEKRVDFAYNLANQYTTIARYNDTDGGSSNEVAASTYSYDTLGRITGLEYERGGTDLFTPYSWTYDSTNRITQFVSADGTSDYSHDKTSQLTAADHNYQTDESYAYDANGNRTMTGYTTGTNNQLTNDGTYSYEYDDEGNRTKRTNDTTSEVTEYEWDFRNRLTKVTEKDGTSATTQVVEYTYDVYNRRIGKEVDTTSPFDMADAAIERYIYDDLNGITSVDGGNVILDFVDPDGTGSQPSALSSRQLFGNAVDQILAQEDVTESLTSPDRVLWHLTDRLQTVRDLAKNDGTLGEHYKYDSFGQIISGDTSVTRYLYTSREYDADTGLQYNRARWYDAAVGQWVSPDPLAFRAGDTNLERYVHNSPTNLFDPSGLKDTTVTIGDSDVDIAIEQEIQIPFFEQIEVIVGQTDGDNLVVILIGPPIPPIPEDAEEEIIDKIGHIIPEFEESEDEPDVTIDGEEVDVVLAGGSDDYEVSFGNVDDVGAVILVGPPLEEIAEDIVEATIEKLEQEIQEAIGMEILWGLLDDYVPLDWVDWDDAS